MELDETILRNQLKNVVQGDIIGFELSNLSRRSGESSLGSTRNYLIHVFTARMRGAEEDRKTDQAAVYLKLLQGIRRVPDDEPIYLWTAIQQHGRVSGYSTPCRLVGVCPYDFYKVSADDKPAS